jgi:hypothetical protein
MRDALKNAGDGELGILNGLKGVRQELEEVKVVKELSGVVEETLKNDLLLENGEFWVLFVGSLLCHFPNLVHY